MSQPAKKKAKPNKLAEAAAQAWEHYRNYDESVNDDNDEGDTDELEELLQQVLKPHMESNEIGPLKSLQNLKNEPSITQLLPILISAAYYHLADVAIGQCLEQDKNKDTKKILSKCKHLVEQSLHWYPENASMASMAANFGRMFQLLSPASLGQLYEQAVENAVTVREQSLKLLEAEDTSPKAKEWIELLLLNHVAGVEYVVDEEKEEETNEEEEEKSNKASGNKQSSKKRKPEEEDIEKEEEDEGYFSTSSVEATARFMAAMLQSTAGQQEAAKQHLQHFPVTHRVHPNLWQPPAEASDKESSKVAHYKSPKGVLPTALYQRLCQVFAPQAAYWKESDYNHRGYYSYYMDKPPTATSGSFQVTNLMDDIIWNHLYLLIARQQQSNDDTKIVGAEWWVHTRAIQANLGHNLHFDTDEALLAQESKITHPLYSSVMYLTGGTAGGGATVVFDQTPYSQQVAPSAWRCVPQDNTLMVFEGNLLHGVLPCPGVKHATDGEETAVAAESSIQDQWIQAPSNKNNDDTPHRLTLLVGFWTRRVPDHMKNRRLYGPCAPLPPRPDKEQQQHTWVEEIHHGYDGDSHNKTEPPQSTIATTGVPVISPAWETLEPNMDDLLEIPRGIDHRFFVQDAPKCFRDNLFEKNDDDEKEAEAEEEEAENAN